MSRLLAHKGVMPQLDATVFVADGARIIGRVAVGADSGIWFNCVLRADDATITVGERTNIQDGAIVHCQPGSPATIGDSVTIGHNAIIHGCIIGDECLIGMGAVVLTGAEIGEGCIICAGSLITAGKKVAAGSFVAGSSGRVIRRVSAEERETIRASAQHYLAQAREYLAAE